MDTDIDIKTETPIPRSGLSKRAYSVLRHNGITTMEQLAECSEGKLYSFRNFGHGCYRETLALLHSYNMAVPGKLYSRETSEEFKERKRIELVRKMKKMVIKLLKEYEDDIETYT